VAYFGAPGLPAELVRVPLEYLRTALDWLKKRPEVDPSRIGVMGGSRGGELALLLGATYPDIKAVVALEPSGYLWPGAGTGFGPDRAAWTLGGQDLPFVPSSTVPPTVTTDPAGNTVYAEAPSFLASIRTASASVLARAAIHVEATHGAVLMLAGADDQLWAACTLSQVAVDRLVSSGHSAAHPDQFRCYSDVGHWIVEPGLPTTASTEYYLPALGAWIALGGTPPGIAKAARDSDGRIRTFLAQALR
jgi:acetyl esterase/lipase